MEPEIQSNSETKRQYWQGHIDNWKSSSLSQKHYCQVHSLALSTFCYWKKKFTPADLSPPRFYPLTLSPAQIKAADAGLTLFVGHQKQYQVQRSMRNFHL